MYQRTDIPELLAELLNAIVIQRNVDLYRHVYVRHIVMCSPHLPERAPAQLTQQTIAVLDYCFCA